MSVLMSVIERAIQMYCDVHRLFLQMVAEHPLIVKEADTKLQQFIDFPELRKRSVTPDLGDLIDYPLLLLLFVFFCFNYNITLIP
jgi:hypothetical protein